MKEYLNFFGDNGSFVFTKPNKSPIVGNPDRFAQDFFGEDGLDSRGLTDSYASFDGQEGFMNHPGWFGDMFRRNNDEDESEVSTSSTSELLDTLNEYGNEPIDIGVDNSSDTEDESKWFQNINWGNVGDFTKGFASGLGKKRNPLTNIPSGNIDVGQQTTTTTTTEAGLGGSSKIIGLVLVGGVVLASVFYAIKMSRD